MTYDEFGNKANSISVQENYYYMPTQQTQETITVPNNPLLLIHTKRLI
jgi:hypothetical protein